MISSFGVEVSRQQNSVCHHLRDLLEGEVGPKVVHVDVGETGGAGHGVRHRGGVVTELPLPHVDLVDGDPDGDVGVHHLQPGDLRPQPADLLLLVVRLLQDGEVGMIVMTNESQTDEISPESAPQISVSSQPAFSSENESRKRERWPVSCESPDKDKVD